MSLQIRNVVAVEPVGTNYDYKSNGRTSIDVLVNRLVEEDGLISKGEPKRFLVTPNRYTLLILNKDESDVTTAISGLSLSGEYVTDESAPGSPTVYREIYAVESVDSQILTDVQTLITAEFPEITFTYKRTFTLLIPFPDSMTQERLLRALDMIKRTVEDVIFLAKNRQTQTSFGRLA